MISFGLKFENSMVCSILLRIVTFTGTGKVFLLSLTLTVETLRFWWVPGDTILPLSTPSPIQSLLLFPLTRREMKVEVVVEEQRGNAEETGIPETRASSPESPGSSGSAKEGLSLPSDNVFSICLCCLDVPTQPWELE